MRKFILSFLFMLIGGGLVLRGSVFISQNKLKMLQSIQPLDNNLVAFHFVQQPNLVMAEKPYVISTGIGAGFGIILSLLAMMILGAGRNKKAKE